MASPDKWLAYCVGFAGLWLIFNGLLHDILVIRNRKIFDKDLIRLLIDGHILIFSGILYLVCYQGVRDHEALAFTVAIVNCLFVLGYCGLIYKILPAVVVIVMNVVVLIWLVMEHPLRTT